MKKIIILTILLSSLALLTGCSSSKQNTLAQAPPKQNQVCFQDTCFEIELATTPEQWTHGLMYRESLNQNKGMLFVYDQEYFHSIWMKNMQFPLDIIWLNENQEVVYIYQNVQPCQSSGCACKPTTCPAMNPQVKSKYVLEVNAGKTDEVGLKIGDKVKIGIN